MSGRCAVSTIFKDGLTKLLFQAVGEAGPDLPQYAGRLLPGISSDDYSVCYVSRKKEPPPDAEPAKWLTELA